MTNQVIASAKTLFSAYREALTGLEAGLGSDFSKTVDLMRASTGHVVVCGMGKSGIIGRKISATLASTGTPSLFLHPAEAIHGDLGMVRPGDVMILISNSGETEEIVRLLPALQRLDAKIIALTAGQASSMARAALCGVASLCWHGAARWRHGAGQHVACTRARLRSNARELPVSRGDGALLTASSAASTGWPPPPAPS